MMWLQGHLDSFAVFGSDYPTPDGTAIRDYIHVCDLADAHVVALERSLAGGKVGALNLGAGRGHSVKDVLAEIERVTGINVRASIEPRRPGDPPVLIANPRRAKERLGFSVPRSDLENIIRSAWAWHQKEHPQRPGEATRPENEA
jgi:UDP-arabinose 4-epimerase